MGDFNAVVNPRRDRSRDNQQFIGNDEPEISLFNYLLNEDFLNI